MESDKLCVLVARN